MLRSIARELPGIVCQDLWTRYSTPKWIVEQWMEQYGEEKTLQMLAGQYKQRPLTIRANLLKTTKEQLKERLQAEGVCVQEVDGTACALSISDYDHLRALSSFREGLFQVQDVSSMQAALLAAPKAGDYCIDVCAAPGGKSLHLAELMRGTGFVEARDLTLEKVALIEENIARMGTENIKALQMDATILDEGSIQRADVVLADLPCSGLGVLGKKRDLKYRISREQQKELVILQRLILDTVCRYVKPGGT